MSRNEEIAMVLRAAARGYMAPYNFQPPPGAYQEGSGGGWSSPCYDGKSYDAAKSVAGALDAIAAVYEGLAKTDAEKLTDKVQK